MSVLALYVKANANAWWTNVKDDVLVDAAETGVKFATNYLTEILAAAGMTMATVSHLLPYEIDPLMETPRRLVKAGNYVKPMSPFDVPARHLTYMHDVELDDNVPEHRNSFWYGYGVFPWPISPAINLSRFRWLATGLDGTVRLLLSTHQGHSVFNRHGYENSSYVPQLEDWSSALN